MVTEEIRVQKAIKAILVEEIEKHLKSNNNFDKVQSLASLVEPYNEKPDTCSENCKGMCAGCYDGKYSLDWRATSNIYNEKPFRYLSDHETDKLIDALGNKVHTCDEWCSDFICYKYEPTSCKTWYCENLFLKEKKNIKYCSSCRGLAYI